MLQGLFIRNFALIQEVRLSFDRGYTVITGETGSGKSILLNALHLILGERADFKVIGPHGDKAVVEAEFAIEPKQFAAFFKENDIDPDGLTIVRREISVQGRSRAFINDTPVQLTVLKEFTENLVSIHSQYNTLDLKRRDYQLQALDVLAGITKERNELEETYKMVQSQRSELRKLQDQLNDEQRDEDYNTFQLAELQSLGLQDTNYGELEVELNKMEHAGELLSSLGTIDGELVGDGGIIERLNGLRSVFGKIARLDESFQDLEERINSVLIELKDMEATVNQYGEDLDVNPERKQELLDRMDAYNRIVQKHRLAGQDELIALMQDLEQKSVSSEALQERIAELETELQLKEDQLLEMANRLHANRLGAIDEIEGGFTDLLSDLKLPDTRLQFVLTQLDKIGATGNTQIELLFSANKGIAPVPIENAASGGELSRVMLALQKMISDKQQMPTIFFDEIDTGVSGDVALKIGNVLNGMGQRMQLFAISHLPQVAAKAQHHLKVEKVSSEDATQTRITALSKDARIEEIARLMSGERINEAAISNAKALMA